MDGAGIVFKGDEEGGVLREEGEGVRGAVEADDEMGLGSKGVEGGESLWSEAIRFSIGFDPFERDDSLGGEGKVWERVCGVEEEGGGVDGGKGEAKLDDRLLKESLLEGESLGSIERWIGGEEAVCKETGSFFSAEDAEDRLIEFRLGKLSLLIGRKKGFIGAGHGVAQELIHILEKVGAVEKEIRAGGVGLKGNFLCGTGEGLHIERIGDD